MVLIVLGAVGAGLTKLWRVLRGRRRSDAVAGESSTRAPSTTAGDDAPV